MNPRIVFALTLIAVANAPAQSTKPASQATVRNSVQKFYDWYAPYANRPKSFMPWMRALRRKGLAFSPELTRALRRDSVAQARAKGELVGLDYDPLLNSQDPCRRYTVSSVTRRASTFSVEVRGAGGCGRHTTPDVVMELRQSAGRLEVVNVRDPAHGNGDLLSALDRLHPDKRSARR